MEAWVSHQGQHRGEGEVCCLHDPRSVSHCRQTDTENCSVLLKVSVLRHSEVLLVSFYYN